MENLQNLHFYENSKEYTLLAKAQKARTGPHVSRRSRVIGNSTYSWRFHTPNAPPSNQGNDQVVVPIADRKPGSTIIRCAFNQPQWLPTTSSAGRSDRRRRRRDDDTTKSSFKWTKHGETSDTTPLLTTRAYHKLPYWSYRCPYRDMDDKVVEHWRN